MGRKSTVDKFLNKNLGGVKLIEELDIREGRLFVKCLCLICEKIFEAKFHNIYKGHYKSCGCQRFKKSNKNPKWKGVGLVSASYFFSLKKGAKDRGLSFLITLQEIWDLFKKQNGKCALSGIELKFNSERKMHDGNASLDRINSEIGYIISNVQWVDKTINMSKQQMNNEQFIKMCKEVYEYSK
jgi:hypothetical protein